MNTTELLAIAQAICPDRDGLAFEGRRWTFAELDDRANRLANALDGLGVTRGDRVCMLDVNGPRYVEAYFAVAKRGAIFVPLNFRANAEELRYMISHAEAKIVLAGDRYLDVVDSIRRDLPSVREVIAVEGGPGLTYEELIRSSSADELVCEIGDDDTTILMYTSGTTGRPKGVPLRHDALVTYVLDHVDAADPDLEERNILTVPLYHVAGMQAMLAAVYGGRTLVLMKQFEVTEWMETVEREQATRAMLVPTMLKRIIDDPGFHRYDLRSLSIITYGAASMPFEVIEKAIRMMPGVRFINAFGQTETASTIAMLGPDDHVIEGSDEEKAKRLRRLASSIGRPLPDVDVKIVDEAGKALGRGQVGEIVAKGSRIMTGYWRDDEKTQEVLTADGWLHTRDMGWMDEEGYIYLAGRTDDMIIRGGENISPEVVENVLNAHPKVEEAAVIGVPDAEWGQQPRAVITLKKRTAATPEEIIEYCQTRLAGFERPRSVVFVDGLPRNAMGKLLLKRIREEYGHA